MAIVPGSGSAETLSCGWVIRHREEVLRLVLIKFLFCLKAFPEPGSRSQHGYRDNLRLVLLHELFC